MRNANAPRALGLHLLEWEAIAVKKLVVFLMMVALGFSGQRATAQDLFESQTLGELPPQITVPSPTDSLPSDGVMMEMPEEPISSESLQESLSSPASSGDLANEAVENPAVREFQLFDCDPALLESTGTWLRRGYWFAEADAVIYQRHFDRHGVVLMADLNINPIFFQRNILAIDGSRPGAEGAPRLKVGRFLFRDHMNRDHNLEFIAFGGGNWSQEGRLDGDELEVPLRLRGPNLAFDDADSTQYRYDSWFNNFELNYHVKQRMLRDRMELEPSGHWVRRAQPSRSLSMLAGVRYFNLDEHLNWMAFGIPDGDDPNTQNETGVYDIQVGNHLIGTQLGLSQTHETARWSIGGQVKGGMYLNMIDLDSSFSVSGDVTSGRTDLQGDNLSWIGEAALIGKYHIRPNLSLRATLEVLHVTSVALAPNQIDFVPSGSPYISMANEAVYLGGAIGLESYW